MSTKRDNWGKRLTDILKERKVTQKDAAKVIGVNASVMSGWLSGASPNDFQAVKKLADHLKISFTWLMTGQEDSGSDAPAIAEVFEEQDDIFDGYAKIKITRLMPRKKGSK